MIPDILTKHGCTTEEFEKLATSPSPPSKFKDWQNRMSGRISDGYDRSIKDWKIYWAMDLAYDIPFRQVTETLVFDLFSGKLDKKGVENAVKEMKLTHLMREVAPIDGNDSTKTKVLDLPVFFNVFVPLVKAYLTHRWGKLYNDRNVIPFFKYEPARMTIKEKVKGEIWTDVIQVVSNNMGTPSRMRQAYLQTLHYGECLQFPVESWYKEKFIDADGEEAVRRQGIRYHFPHPTRAFWDPAFPASSFNTDTGCKFAAYWQVTRLSELKGMSTLWNRDKIAVGVNDRWFTSNDTYFKTVYPCRITYPSSTYKSGAGQMDRERTQEDYTSDSQDSSVVLTNYFEKIVPSEIGLGTYEFPVWFRIMVANSRDIVYAEPICYSPVVYRGYDADENRVHNSSLTLDLLPFQDHLGNLLTHYILSVKQNLEQVIFYDQEQLSPKQMEVIKNIGQSRYSSRQWVPMNTRENRFAKLDNNKAITEAPVRNHNTFEVMTAIRTMIEIMERSLGFSPQEVGQSATHEQSREEIKTISTNTGGRIQFTGSFIDDGDYATQRQQYEGYLAYGDDEVFAQVTLSDGDSDKKKAIESLGLKIEDEPGNGEPKAGVRGKKESVMLDTFINYRNSGNRTNDAAIVTAMSQFVQAIIANPNVMMSVGAKQVIEIWNMMARMSGLFPRDFEIRYIEPSSTPEGQQAQALAIIPQLVQAMGQMKQQMDQVGPAMQQMGQQLGQAIQQVGPAVLQEVAAGIQPITQEIQGLKSNDEMIAQQIVQMKQVIETAMQAPPVQVQEPPMPTPEEIAAGLINAIPQGTPIA
jgi:hypothetical protein